MFEFLLVGISLGLTSGMSPGPLLTLVISETLNHGLKAGIKVALAILITDIPMIIIVFYTALTVVDFRIGLGVLSIMGGFFLFYHTKIWQ